MIETLKNILNVYYICIFAVVYLFVLVLVYLCKIWYSYKVFSRLGIQTPPYRFIYGNFPEIRKNRNYSDVIRKWTEIYGKTYGYYQCHTPILVTSDLNLIQEVFIKQHSNFAARKKAALHRNDNDPRVSLFASNGVRWKKLRTIINPTFSPVKLRELSPLLVMCDDRFINKLRENDERDINISPYLKRLTMDAIWNCAFGIDIDLQNDPKNPYLEKSEDLFRETSEFTTKMVLGLYFPEISPILTNIDWYYDIIRYKLFNIEIRNPFSWLVTMIRDIINHRKSMPTNRRDFVKLLLEAEANENTKLEEEPRSNDYTKTHIFKKLSIEEIERNLVGFMLAGYETTSTALTYAFYVLATIPEEQEKLHREISEQFPIYDESIEINVDTVQKLEYMDMFIKEVLRIYPVVNAAITRRCIKSTIVNNMKIPEGLVVTVDVLSIHYNEELWGPVDPNKFYPLRFSPECKRNPLAFMAFGQGPRFCIGMKFALLEMKIVLSNILRCFEIHKTTNTPENLTFTEGIVRTPKDPVCVLLKKRQFI